jgi:probable phosphoglycerate mutase
VVSDAAGNLLAEVAEGIGVATNNVAEYTAAIRGLERARELGATEVRVRSDSRLLIEQLSGRWKIKNQRLRSLARQARSVASAFGHVSYEHVPRERNVEADRLANEGVNAWLAERDASPGRPPPSPRRWGAVEEQP